MRRFLSFLPVILFTAIFCGAQQQPDISIEDAYRAYISIPTFPRIDSENDRQWVRALQKNPEATAQFLLPLVSRGQPAEIVRKARSVLLVLPKDLLLRTVHQAEATYPLGDPDFPVFLMAIDFGEIGDLERLKAEIVYAPDSERAQKIAIEFASSVNPAAQQALLQIQAPGRWQEHPEVKAFLAKHQNAVPGTRATTPMQTTSSGIPVPASAQAPSGPQQTTRPEAPANKAAVPAPSPTPNTPVADPKEGGVVEWWRWVIGGILLVGALVFILRKRGT